MKRVLRMSGGLIAVFAGLLMLAPVVWMLAASLKPEAAIHADTDSLRSFWPATVTFTHYVDAATRTPLVAALANSLLVVAWIAVGGLLVNGPAAYAFARMRFAGRDLLFMTLVASIILPIEVIVIPLLITLRPLTGLADLVGERGWVVTALAVPFMAKAFNIFLLRQHFAALPRSLEEAAFLDGSGWWRTYWRVALPNIKPGIVTVCLLDFVVHWNDFLWPVVICRGETTQTMQIGLATFFTQPPVAWGSIMAYALLATVPVMLAFLVGQRWIVASVATSGAKG